MAGEHRLGSWRLLRRSLAHRRGQTLLLVVVSACISATAVFVSGYSAQAQQAIVDVTFSADDAGSAWVLTGPPNVDLATLPPAGSDRYTDPPVEARTADVRWSSPRFEAPISATMAWQADVCAHLTMVSGRCPRAAGEVAVSTTDAASYRVRLGDRLDQSTISAAPVALRLVGVYRERDRGEAYWFGSPPTGRSGRDQSTDQPLGDELVATHDQFRRDGYLEVLSLRLDRSVLRTGDLEQLDVDTKGLSAAAVHAGGRLTTQVPVNLQRVAEERGRVVTGLALTLTQLAALVLVVLALLASVALSSLRAELGLRRLRGERAPALVRLALAPWAAAITAGWLLGWLPGMALLALVASRLPGAHGLPPAASVAIAPVVAWAVMIAVLVPGARSLLAQPVIALLQAAPSAVGEARLRQQLVDGAAVVVAGCGVLVAVQAGTSSVLGLLVPSLLAVGLGVLLFRVLLQVAVRQRRQLARQGLTDGLLTAILVIRLRGLKILTVAICLAAAFALFAVQLQVIGAAVRRNVAEVSSGAAAVLEVDGNPSAVLSTLDRLDPQHGTAAATMAAVVLTRRPDPTALRAMFVEPVGFAQVAFGAGRTADREDWSRVAAPQIDPVALTGDAVTVEIGDHVNLKRTAIAGDTPALTGTRAEVSIDYLTSDGSRLTRKLGQLRLSAGAGQRFRQPIPCSDGCRLLRITLASDGPMGGTVPLTTVATERGGVEQPVDLGGGDGWLAVPTSDPDATIRLNTGVEGLSLDVSSSGGPVAVQHAWAPVVLPVIVAGDVRLGSVPSVATPNGSGVPIQAVARAADAVPGQLTGVAVGDLTSILRSGAESVAPGTRVQIWLAPAAVARLGSVTSALADQRITVVRTQRASSALFAQQHTASALTGRIATALAALAALCAALGIVLTVAGQEGVLGRDLAALGLAGVPRDTLRRAVLHTYLGTGLFAIVLGCAAGAVGCRLVVGSLPLLPAASPAIHNDLGLHLGAGLACLAVAVVLLVVTVVTSVRALLRRATTDQLRSTR